MARAKGRLSDWHSGHCVAPAGATRTLRTATRLGIHAGQQVWPPEHGGNRGLWFRSIGHLHIRDIVIKGPTPCYEEACRIFTVGRDRRGRSGRTSLLQR